MTKNGVAIVAGTGEETMESDEEWGGGFRKARITVRRGLRHLAMLAKTMPNTDEETGENEAALGERMESRWETTGRGIMSLRDWMVPRMLGPYGLLEGLRKRDGTVLTTEEWPPERVED